MCAKVGKPFSGPLQNLVKKRCHAQNLQLEDDISRFHRLLIHHPPSIIAINGQLKSIAKSKHPNRYPTVLALFNILKGTCRHSRTVSPTVHTFGLVLDCCRRMRRADLGFCVVGQSLRYGCSVNTVMFGSLINGLCAMKQFGVAAKVLAKMPLMGCAPNLIIYSTLIDHLCSNGDTRTGLELCRQMVKGGRSCCKPNVVTYNSLIYGFFVEGDVALAQMMFEEMVSEFIAVAAFSSLFLSKEFLEEQWEHSLRFTSLKISISMADISQNKRTL
ncbi:hypothetical protein LUZ62_084111 [Rhynchospora pubera]|uniref:Pentatricopeptide repeat-containing protein n=1 Tax=Rhynchospora pubera TaxID=906938 RepID=A0AAV8C2K9_9POAL|nr:hypothetical protein LUZ62_084111 [Rhynchospora pubera]